MLEMPFHLPPAGARTRLGDGLWWFRLPLPYVLDHIDLYLLEGEGERVLVDTGHADDVSQCLLAQVLGERLDRILVTHFHPDHVGNAGHLAARYGSTLAMPRLEWAMARMLAFEPDEAWRAALAAYDRLLGVEAELGRRRLALGNVFARAVTPPPGSFQQLRDGMVVRLAGLPFRVMLMGGHAPAHALFYQRERRLLIAGDQILPEISPLVGVWPDEPEGNPLGDYLAALERLAGLPEDVLVLPGHGRPFRGLRARVAAIRAHHQERLARTLELCRDWASVCEVALALFDRPLDETTVGFALAEALAHLNYLHRRGELVRESGADGAWRFRRR